MIEFLNDNIRFAKIRSLFLQASFQKIFVAQTLCAYRILLYTDIKISTFLEKMGDIRLWITKWTFKMLGLPEADTHLYFCTKIE